MGILGRVQVRLEGTPLLGSGWDPAEAESVTCATGQRSGAEKSDHYTRVISDAEPVFSIPHTIRRAGQPRRLSL
jgi:hypothetical protein